MQAPAPESVAHLSKLLVDGELVIASARKLDSIKDLQKDSVKVHQLDVTSPPQDLAAQLENYFGRAPNCLFSNAGYGLAGAAEEVTTEELQAQFDTNYFGLLQVQRLLLPGIRSYGDEGWVITNTSIGAWWSSAGFAAYQGTKHALAAMSRSLAEELKSFGTHVMAIEIGLARTGFFGNNAATGRNAGYVYAKGGLGVEAYEKQKQSRVERFRNFAGKEPSSPEKIAERIIDVVRNEGGAKGRTPPLELPLGAEAFEMMRPIFQKKLAEMDEWREFGSDVKIDE